MKFKTVKLGNVCKTTSGGTPKRDVSEFYDGEIPWIKSGELKDCLITKANETISKNGLENSSAKLIPKGTLMIAMYGATVGKLGILDIEAATNQAVCAITPSSEINQKYLFHYLLKIRKNLIERSFGGAQPNISQDIIRNLEIPLPPLDEQKRIAAVLDKADALREKRRAAITKLDELLQSVFLDMFGDPVSNPKGWESGSIELVVKNKSDVRCGPFGTQLKVDELVDSGIPLYGIENVRDNKFNPKVSKFLTENKAEQLNAFDVKPNDVLITRMGTIGKACVVPTNIGKARFSYHLFRVRPDIQRCLPKFLTATINRSGTFQNQLRNVAHGAIMAGLNTTNLKQVKFLLPPISNQHKYVEIVDKIEIEKEKFELGLSQTESLFQSLQQRAFAGELFGAANDEIDSLKIAAAE